MVSLPSGLIIAPALERQFFKTSFSLLIVTVRIAKLFSCICLLLKLFVLLDSYFYLNLIEMTLINFSSSGTTRIFIVS